MTIIEALDRTDSLVPNGYTVQDKIRWLSMLDGMISRDIFLTHEDAPMDEPISYSEDVPIDTSLLVPHPYDELYVYFLASRIHYSNEEYAKYNNALIMYNSLYSRFAASYNSLHAPKGRKLKFF